MHANHSVDLWGGNLTKGMKRNRKTYMYSRCPNQSMSTLCRHDPTPPYVVAVAPPTVAKTRHSNLLNSHHQPLTRSLTVPMLQENVFLREMPPKLTHSYFWHRVEMQPNTINTQSTHNTRRARTDKLILLIVHLAGN
jgi:hypothetical protein